LLQRQDFVTIGKILKTFGNKGEVLVKPLTDFPERFKVLNYAYLYNEDTESFVINQINKSYVFELKDVRKHKENLVIKFAGYESIEQAESLVSLFIEIEGKSRVPLKDGEFYYYEIMNFVVYSDGKKLGSLSAVVNYGGNDLFVIETEAKNELLYPAMKDLIIRIDYSEKKIFVERIEGLTHNTDEI